MADDDPRTTDPAVASSYLTQEPACIWRLADPTSWTSMLLPFATCVLASFTPTTAAGNESTRDPQLLSIGFPLSGCQVLLAHHLVSQPLPLSQPRKMYAKGAECDGRSLT